MVLPNSYNALNMGQLSSFYMYPPRPQPRTVKKRWCRVAGLLDNESVIVDGITFVYESSLVDDSSVIDESILDTSRMVLLTEWSLWLMA
jgi:hypothetical protein